MTSSEDEDLDPSYGDYDKLTDECFNRSQARKTRQEKKRDKKLFTSISRGTIKGPIATKQFPPPRGRKPIRSDFFKRQRHAQRISKELHTVLQVFDFGLSEGAVDVDHERETATVLSEDVDEEEQDLLDDITADAFAELDLTPPSRQPSWDDSIGLALEEVITQHTDKSKPPPIEFEPYVMDLVSRGEEAAEKLSLGDRLAEDVDIGLVLMNEIVEEMQEHCPEDRSDLSWGSASSASSLIYQRDQTLLKLLGTLQRLYEEVWECCLRTSTSLTERFRNPIGIEDDFSYVLKLLKFLKQIKDFELVMCCDGVGKAKVSKKKQTAQAIEEGLLNLGEAMNEAVRSIQGKLFHREHLRPNGESFERLTRSDEMQQCWEGLKASIYRLTRCFPGIKGQLLTGFLRTITSAVEDFADVQDSPQVQDVMTRVKTVISVKAEGDGLSEDEVSAREWLLPCLRKLHSIANDLSKQIECSRSFKSLSDPSTDILSELRRAFERLMSNSVADMICITQAYEHHHLPEIQRRKDCGIRMLQMVLKYDDGRLSHRSEDHDRYEIFRSLTGDLLNNVLRFQTKLQMFEISGSSVLAHEVSLSSSLSPSVFGSPLPDVPYPFKRLSDEQMQSSRIGTIVTDENSSGELRDTFVVSDDTTSMPNPFKDGPGLSNTIQLPDSFYPTQGGQANDLESHPLSCITESSPSETPSPSCPGIDHFYTIKKNELVYGPRLGSGSAGQVFKMWYFNSPVAVKIMHYPKLLETQQRLVHEAKMHMRIARHPNLVQFYGQCIGMEDTDNAVGLVMELCNLGSLLKAVKEAKWIQHLTDEGHDMQPYQNTVGYAFYTNWKLRLKLACDVAAGMEYLHGRGIVHRDLTSYNVVLSEGGRTGDLWVAKVCDFERSRYIPDGDTVPRSNTIPNSPAWSAPEVLRNEEYSTQADVFSMGVILWEIVTLEEPWRQHLDQCIKNPYQVIALVSNHERLEIPPPNEKCIAEYSEMTNLMRDAWNENPEERPTMKEFHKRIMNILRKCIYRTRQQPSTC